MQTRVDVEVKVVPHEPALLSLPADDVRRWVTASFAGGACESAWIRFAEEGAVRARVTLNVAAVPADERALLVAHAHDEALWKAWVEKTFVGGGACTATTSPRVR
jgi:hypothetical protein